MSKYAKDTVRFKTYFTDNSLEKNLSLFEYVEKNADDKIKEAVKPIMKDAKNLAARTVRKGTSKPHSRYSWKLLKAGSHNFYKRVNGRYARALTVRDHSKPQDVFYEVTGAKKEYRLSHLLEHSHKVHPWGNKNITKFTKQIPHMIYAQDKVDKEAPKACEKVIDKLFSK